MRSINSPFFSPIHSVWRQHTFRSNSQYSFTRVWSSGKELHTPFLRERYTLLTCLNFCFDTVEELSSNQRSLSTHTTSIKTSGISRDGRACWTLDNGSSSRLSHQLVIRIQWHLYCAGLGNRWDWRHLRGYRDEWAGRIHVFDHLWCHSSRSEAKQQWLRCNSWEKFHSRCLGTSRTTLMR